MLELSNVIIKDEKTNKYFGYVKQLPAVCAQGDTKDDVINKLYNRLNMYVKRNTSI